VAAPYDFSWIERPRKKHLPEGRTPFFLGDKAAHPASARSPERTLEETLAWAAGLERTPPEEEGEVRDLGTLPPIDITEPQVRVRAAGQVSRADEQHLLNNARRGPLKVPASLRAVYEEAPEVATYLSSLDDELGTAQGQSQDRLLAARLSHAGAMANTAISGARHEEDAYRGLEEGARQPVDDLLERRKSQASRAAAELTAQEAAEERARHERDVGFRTTQADRADELARLRMEQDAQQHLDNLRARAQDRHESREERRFRMETEGEARRTAADAKRQDMRERQSERDLQEIGARTSKAPFGELQRALEDIDGLAPGLAYGQVPKESPLSLKDRAVRSLPFGAGEWAMSDEGKKYAATVSNLRDLVSRMRSGAVLNEGEERHYLKLIGDHVLSDPAMAAAGINEVRRGVAQKLHNAQAPYSEIRDGKKSVLDTYEGTGASTYRAPIFSVERSQTPVRTGRHKRDKQGRMWAEMSDGSAVEVR
jgi:hypothetical protein